MDEVRFKILLFSSKPTVASMLACLKTFLTTFFLFVSGLKVRALLSKTYMKKTKVITVASRRQICRCKTEARWVHSPDVSNGRQGVSGCAMHNLPRVLWNCALLKVHVLISSNSI